MNYQDLLKAINVAPRTPGGCTPPVVDVVEAGGEDVRLLVNALQGWETKHGRKAGAGDEAEVLVRRDQLIANMEAAKAKG
ncbi:hypothetical protein GAY28_10100 [Azospirillum brasilense]|nr:hypothetical protein [Azospirillum brasilense]